MKKAQIEILGFMVVILLIIAGIIFYIKFMPDASSTEQMQETGLNLEVSNMLASIKYQTVCEDTTGYDLIRACIENTFVCDKPDTCGFMVEEVQRITQAYGWEQESYMLFIEDTLYTEECLGINRLPSDTTISGNTVKLHYCYD
jgi:hypothetical protein